MWDVENYSEIITLPTGNYEYTYSIALHPDIQSLILGGSFGVYICPLNFLDDALIGGCGWLQEYLHNLYVNVSDEDRARCDGILHDVD